MTELTTDNIVTVPTRAARRAARKLASASVAPKQRKVTVTTARRALPANDLTIHAVEQLVRDRTVLLKTVNDLCKAVARFA